MKRGNPTPKINPKTIKIFKKTLNISNFDKKTLKKSIFDYCDSIKYIELIIEIEKLLKKKIENTKLKKLEDINKLFNKQK